MLDLSYPEIQRALAVATKAPRVGYEPIGWITKEEVCMARYLILSLLILVPAPAASGSVNTCKQFTAASRDYRIGYINGAMHQFQQDYLFHHCQLLVVKSKLPDLEQRALEICAEIPEVFMTPVILALFGLDKDEIHPTEGMLKHLRQPK